MVSFGSTTAAGECARFAKASVRALKRSTSTGGPDFCLMIQALAWQESENISPATTKPSGSGSPLHKIVLPVCESTLGPWLRVAAAEVEDKFETDRRFWAKTEVVIRNSKV